MGFLGIEPGQANRYAAEKTLAVRRALPKRGSAYNNAYDLLAQHGEWFGGRVTPQEFEHLRGPWQHCHRNSLDAALADSSLRYFTGYYCVAQRLLFHSWCVTPDGGAVELTFPTVMPPGAGWQTTDGGGGEIPWLPPPHWLYVGVEYDTAFVAEAAHRRGFSLPLLDPIPESNGGPDYIFQFPYKKEGFPWP